MVSLLKKGYKSFRNNDIIFVCGGNEDNNMRPKFTKYCNTLSSFDYKVFHPEHAFDLLTEFDHSGNFNLSEFELLIGELSHSIIIFPEAPGSFVETGYFSANKNILKFSILALDEKFIGKRSFINLGPVKIMSQYNTVFNIDYDDPNFANLTDYIKNFGTKRTTSNINIDKFGEAASQDLFYLTFQLVYFLKRCMFDDLDFFFRAIFKNSYSKDKMIEILAVLVGSKYLTLDKDGVIKPSSGAKSSLIPRSAKYSKEETDVLLEISAIM